METRSIEARRFLDSPTSRRINVNQSGTQTHCIMYGVEVPDNNKTKQAYELDTKKIRKTTKDRFTITEADTAPVSYLGTNPDVQPE